MLFRVWLLVDVSHNIDLDPSRNNSYNEGALFKKKTTCDFYPTCKWGRGFRFVCLYIFVAELSNVVLLYKLFLVNILIPSQRMGVYLYVGILM